MEATPRRESLAARVHSLEGVIEELSTALETQMALNQAYLDEQDAFAQREADVAAAEARLAACHAATTASASAAVEADASALEQALRGRRCGLPFFYHPGQPVTLPWTVLAAVCALAGSYFLITTAPSSENAASARAAAAAAAQAMSSAQSTRSVFVAALLQILAFFTSVAVDTEAELPFGAGRLDCLQQHRVTAGAFAAGLAVGVIACAIHILAPLQRLTASYRAATTRSSSAATGPLVSELTLAAPPRAGLRALSARLEHPGSPISRRFEALSPKSFARETPAPGAHPLREQPASPAAVASPPSTPATARTPGAGRVPGAQPSFASPFASAPAPAAAASAVAGAAAAAAAGAGATPARAPASAPRSAVKLTPAATQWARSVAASAAVSAAVSAATSAAPTPARPVRPQAASSAGSAASPGGAASPDRVDVTTDAQDLADAVRGVMYTDYFATAADDEATAVLASPVAPTTPAAATFVEDDGVPFSSVIEARFDASPAPDSAAAARAVAAAAAAAAVAASVDDSWIEAPDVNPAALDRELRAMAARSPQRSFSPQPAAAGRAGAGASAVASPVSPAQKKTPFYHHTPSAAAATAPGATAASSPLRAGGAGTVFYVRGDVDIEYEEPVSASARARSPFTAPAAIISSPQNQRTAAAAAAATAAVGGSPVLHHRYASADDDDYDGDGYDDEDEDAGADEDYYSDRDVEFNPDTDADAEDAYAGGGVGAGAGTGVRANLQETLARAAYAQQQQQHQLQAGVEQSEQRVLFVPAQAPGEPDLFVRASYTRTEEIVPAVVPVAAVAAAGPAPVSAEASLCAQADALAETHDYDAVYDLLHSGASAAAVEASAELLWRAARAAYHTAKAFAKRGDADAVRVRATEGYATAQRAVERDDGCAHAHKWVAILGNQVGELGGQQAKISQAHSFQRHVQRALALSPDDADLHHMMGRFCFEIASLSWTVRKIADVAFGGLPRVSLDDAVRHFRDAERGEPKWALNLVWLGKALAKVGRTAEAEESLAAALALPAERLEDEEAHALARKELEAM